MADIQANESNPKRGRRNENRPAKLDMTPMVDLAFLLLTFFILSTTLSKPRAMELIYPADGPPSLVSDSLANTLLLGEKNSMYYYPGQYKDGITVLKPIELDKGGLRRLIIDKNRIDMQRLRVLEEEWKAGKRSQEAYQEARKHIHSDPRAPYFIIKTMEKTPYGKIVNVIDELQIGDVNKYVVVYMTAEEKKAMIRSGGTAAR
jgi:biopolymer transport protein ExbD